MSLVRLLTAGKSLVGIQDSRSRYQLSDPRAMPKFGSEKKVKSEVAEPVVPKSNAEKPKSTVVKAPTSATKAASSQRTSRGNSWVSQWGSKLSSLVSSKAMPLRSIPRFSEAPVQGELSLDNIKVVRNDLSDADLEVVTKKTAPAQKELRNVEVVTEWTPAESKVARPEKRESLTAMCSFEKP